MRKKQIPKIWAPRALILVHTLTHACTNMEPCLLCGAFEKGVH